MLYQLPNGRVIEISTELYLEMSDEDLEYLVAYNYGDVFENPWTGSVLNDFKIVTAEEEEPDPLTDLLNVSDIEKIIDLDIDNKSDLIEE